MRKRIWLLLVSLLLFACVGKTEPGLLVYEAVDEDGMPTSDLIVADSSGTELRRIQLSEQPSGTHLYPTRSSHKALAMLVADRRFFLVDAQAGTAQELAVDGEGERSILFGLMPFGSGLRRYAVFGDPGDGSAYLVNLETGETTDLLGLNEDIHWYNPGLFSPDEHYLAFYGSAPPIWLVPSADPAKLRRIEASGRFSRGPFAFSSDSQQIAYATRTGEVSTVVVEAADGSKSEEILSTDDVVVALGFVPGQDKKIVVVQEGRTTLLDLGSGQKRDLFAHEGSPPITLSSSPSGQKMLLMRLQRSTESSEDSYVEVYYFLDPLTGETKSLEELSGCSTSTLAWYPDSRWQYFIDSPDIGEGKRLVSLDLKTGDTREILALGEGSEWAMLQPSLPDGKLALAMVRVPDDFVEQLWLLNAQTGEARMLAEGTSTRGMISLDNRWIALSVFKGDGDERSVELDLISVANGERKSLGPGSGPIWLYP